MRGVKGLPHGSVLQYLLNRAAHFQQQPPVDGIGVLLAASTGLFPQVNAQQIRPCTTDGTEPQ